MTQDDVLAICTMAAGGQLTISADLLVRYDELEVESLMPADGLDLIVRARWKHKDGHGHDRSLAAATECD